MEKQFKDCHNEELQKKLDKIITKAKYGGYKPIIDEVFQRRAYEFGDLPEFDIDKEIKTFAKNVRSISTSSKMNFAGRYKKGLISGKIIINKELLQRFSPEELLEIFTHEVGHAITSRNKKDMGLHNRVSFRELMKRELNEVRGKKSEEIIDGSALDEVFVENTATRLVYSGDANNFDVKGSSYTSISFVPSMLAAALGMSEKELLYAGNQSRDIFMQKILERFPEAKRVQAQEKMKTFELNLENMYECLFQTGTKYGIPQMLGKTMNSIFDIANLHMASDTRNVSSEVMVELIYRNTRMRQISDRVIQKLVDEKILPHEKVEDTRSYFESSQKKISDLIFDKYRSKGAGVEITQEQYRANVEKEQFDSGKQWDNTIANKLYSLIERDEKTSVLSNAISTIKNMFVRERKPKLRERIQRHLPSPNPNPFGLYKVTTPKLSKRETIRDSSKGNVSRPDDPSINDGR